MIEIKAVYHAVFEELAGRRGEQITIGQSSFGALIEQLDLRYCRSFGDTLPSSRRRTNPIKATSPSIRES